MQGLEKFIDITITNPNSINKSDISEDSLNYRSLYIKISNLMKDNNIKDRDRFSKLIFEPESLRKEFYAKIIDLNLSNFKEPRTTRIKYFKDTFVNKIMEKYFDGISTSGNSIKREDILETGLDYKSIYIKISNSIRDNNIGANDNLSKLIFKPESLRKDFYAKIKYQDLTNYKEVSKTRIVYLKNRLRSEIVKEYT